MTYDLPDTEGEALDPVECTCYYPDPDAIGECRMCRRLVIDGPTPPVWEPAPLTGCLGAFIAAVACWVIAGAVVILIARRWT